MSRADARHRNLPGSFNGFFARSRNSQSDPKPPFFGKLIEPLHQIADFENGHSDR